MKLIFVKVSELTHIKQYGLILQIIFHRRNVVSTRKEVLMMVTVSVPAWMTAAQARREVRTLINEQSGYLSHGPNYEDVVVKAKKIS